MQKKLSHIFEKKISCAIEFLATAPLRIPKALTVKIFKNIFLFVFGIKIIKCFC